MDLLRTGDGPALVHQNEKERFKELALRELKNLLRFFLAAAQKRTKSVLRDGVGLILNCPPAPPHQQESRETFL